MRTITLATVQLPAHRMSNLVALDSSLHDQRLVWASQKANDDVTQKGVTHLLCDTR